MRSRKRVPPGDRQGHVAHGIRVAARLRSSLGEMRVVKRIGLCAFLDPAKAGGGLYAAAN